MDLSPFSRSGFIDYVVDDGDARDIDRIWSTDTGVGGNDSACTGAGNDIVLGGAGGDDLQTGIGRNIAIGDSALLTSEAGYDANATFSAHPFMICTIETTGFTDGGSDTLRGGDSNDILFGGASGDVTYAGGGNVTLTGGNGNDSIIGGIAKDTLKNGIGNHTLIGGLGVDSVDGEAGTDTALGGQGRPARGGTGFADDDTAVVTAEIIDEVFATQFPFELF